MKDPLDYEEGTPEWLEAMEDYKASFPQPVVHQPELGPRQREKQPRRVLESDGEPTMGVLSRAVYLSMLPSQDKRVLVTLILFARPNLGWQVGHKPGYGSKPPGHRSIAAWNGMNKDTVTKIIARLEEGGLVKVVRHKPRWHTYHLVVDKIRNLPREGKRRK